MTLPIREGMVREDGFTLIELLVVVLVIGILAAIALPIFLGQREKAQDADAKANARHVYGLIEQCLTEQGSRDYTLCDTNAELGDSSFTIGTDPGQVHITKYADPDSEYRVKAYSESGGAFRIIRSTTGVSRTCTQPGTGGCRAVPGNSEGTW
jgi:type IV pilus assembly protein PilA